MNELHAFAPTLSRCSSHSSGVQTDLHGQTYGSGQDASHLRHQQWLGILERGPSQESPESAHSMFTNSRSGGKLLVSNLSSCHVFVSLNGNDHMKLEVYNDALWFRTYRNCLLNNALVNAGKGNLLAEDLHIH